MPNKLAVRHTLLAAAALASVLALPRIASADDDQAARAAAASDPEYAAAYKSSWNAQQKVEPTKAYVTKEEFKRFQEEVFARINREHEGKDAPAMVNSTRN